MHTLKRTASLLKKVLAVLPFCAFSLLAQEWTFEGTRSDWTGTYNLTSSATAEGLKFHTTGRNSNIAADTVNFAPGERNFLLVEYQADSIATAEGGYLFFGTAEDNRLDEEKKFYLPALVDDSQPHELLVSLKDHARAKAFEIWKNASAITRLRLDLVADANADVLIKSIRFLNLNEEELKARLFKEEIARGIPLSLPVDMPNADGNLTAPSPKDAVYVSPMVAPSVGFEYVGTCYLRRTFRLGSGVDRSLWQSICDDGIEEVWLNGHLVEHDWSANWMLPDCFEIPADYFLSGRNVLAVRYRNTGNLGGLMMDLQLVLKNGASQVITMENSQSCNGDVPSGWYKPQFDDSAWEKAIIRRGPPAEPWANYQPQYKTLPAGESVARVRVVKQEGLSVDVCFEQPGGFQPEDRFCAYFCSANGQVIREFSGTAEELNGVAVKDGVRFHFKDHEGEYYGVPSRFQWEFGMVGRGVQGTTHLDITSQEHAVPGMPLVTGISQTERGPVPMLNGSPCYFNVLTVHNYKDTESIQTGMDGANSPFNVIAIRLGGMTNIWWTGPDQYDFSEVDRSLNLILQHYPGCYLGLYVWCQPGDWYTKTYPERISRMEDGSIYNYYVSAIDFANPDYRADAARALTALVEHLEKYFGSRTFLYNLMGGISCEWQGWAAHSDQYADFSKGATQEFQDYAAAHGMKAGAVPTRAEREASLDGIFRCPSRHAAAILYDQFYSEAIADCIAQLAAAVKNACHRAKIVGCYYGYLMEYANLGHCTNGGGHNALQKLLDCPDMDFFLSPQSYAIRSLGAPNADMKPYGAIYNAGKFSILEDDTRTHLTFKTDFEQTLNLECTLNVLKRNVGMALAHATPLNHLPLVGGNELNHPAIRAMFTRTMQGGQYLMENGSLPSAEIAAVIDEDAIRYRAATRASVQVNDRSRYFYNHDGAIKTAQRYVQPITGDLLYYQRIPLAQFGAPVDVVLLEDILKYPAKYKMVIFLNAVKDKPELRQAIRLLRDNGAKVVFTYGTGFLDDEGISLETLSENIGMTMDNAGEGPLRVQFDATGEVTGHAYKARTRFKVMDETAVPLARYYGTDDVAVAEKDGMYFYGTTDLSRDFLRMVAQKAGVHIFLEAEDDNLYASRDVVSIHANHAGNKTIHLPRPCDVVDLFSGEVLARQTTSFEIYMTAFESRVFLTGDAAKILPHLK